MIWRVIPWVGLATILGVFFAGGIGRVVGYEWTNSQADGLIMLLAGGVFMLGLSFWIPGDDE